MSAYNLSRNYEVRYQVTDHEVRYVGGGAGWSDTAVKPELISSGIITEDQRYGWAVAPHVIVKAIARNEYEAKTLAQDGVTAAQMLLKLFHYDLVEELPF